MLRSLMPLASASASYLGTCPLRSHTELADFRQADFTGYPVVFCDARASRMSKPYSGVVHDSSPASPPRCRSKACRYGFRISPRLRAIEVASARVEAPRFAKMTFRWYLTQFVPMSSMRAMSLFE